MTLVIVCHLVATSPSGDVAPSSVSMGVVEWTLWTLSASGCHFRRDGGRKET